MGSGRATAFVSERALRAHTLRPSYAVCRKLQQLCNKVGGSACGDGVASHPPCVSTESKPYTALRDPLRLSRKWAWKNFPHLSRKFPSRNRQKRSPSADAICPPGGRLSTKHFSNDRSVVSRLPGTLANHRRARLQSVALDHSRRYGVSGPRLSLAGTLPAL